MERERVWGNQNGDCLGKGKGELLQASNVCFSPSSKRGMDELKKEKNSFWA
jgi:hypothetical protein